MTAALHEEAFELPAGDPAAAAAGLRIRGEARIPVRPPGATAQGVILCHGFKGFGRWGFFPYLAERLAAEGLTAVTFDFSGSGVGPDRETFTELHAFAANSLSSSAPSGSGRDCPPCARRGAAAALKTLTSKSPTRTRPIAIV